jgi:putative thioredoxin
VEPHAAPVRQEKQTMSELPDLTADHTDDFIFDATEENFEARVVMSPVPVIVDFWASWCQPCKLLKPLLEKLVTQRGGKIALARVDVDKQQRIAMAFGINSIPDVVAFAEGRPVDRFTGLLPEKELAEFLDRLLPTEAQNLVEQARGIEDSGDVATAEKLYRQALEGEEFLDEARVGLARLLLARGEHAEVAKLLEMVNCGGDTGDEALALKARSWFAGRPGINTNLQDCSQKVASSQGKEKARALYELGCCQAMRGDYPAALESLVTAGEDDVNLLNGPVKEAMIQCFHALGDIHPVTTDYRNRLMMLLC